MLNLLYVDLFEKLCDRVQIIPAKCNKLSDYENDRKM